MHEIHSHEDSQWRSIAKAVSYRIVIIILDFAFIYLFTRNTEIAIGFVLVSNLYTTVAYYLHERVWNGISWGKLHTKA